MTSPEFNDPITWDELVWALVNVRFPELGSSGFKTLPEATGDSAQHAATQLFRNVSARKAEAGKWIMGALYADGYPGPHPRVYLREEGGWLAIGSQARIADGGLSTRDFKLLTPTSPDAPLIQQASFAPPHTFVPPYPAEYGPLKQLNLPGHDVRGTAHSHAQGWYHNCPGCKAAAVANAEHRDRLRATEGEH